MNGKSVARIRVKMEVLVMIRPISALTHVFVLQVSQIRWISVLTLVYAVRVFLEQIAKTLHLVA